MASEVMTADEMWYENVSYFESEVIQTKDDLMDSLERLRKDGAKKFLNGKVYSPTFYKSLDALLDEFITKVQETNLPDPLPEPYSDEKFAEHWGYAIEISNTGIKLCLQLESMDRVEDDEPAYGLVENFVLIEITRELPLTESEKEASKNGYIICLSSY